MGLNQPIFVMICWWGFLFADKGGKIEVMRVNTWKTRYYVGLLDLTMYVYTWHLGRIIYLVPLYFFSFFFLSLTLIPACFFSNNYILFVD